MSSYQIKSTPYFQRMLSKSKKNGELQRLKDEYERIKDFSDYTIALRIRQVRLWRLFRKIQDINAVSSSRVKTPRKQPKTYEQMRAETLSRARNLGMEFSRENGLNIQRHNSIPPARSSLYLLNSKSQNSVKRVPNKISTTARRVNYGNVTSYENMRRFKTHKRKFLVPNISKANSRLRSASSIAVDKVEKLRKCTTYDGSNASFNEVLKKRYSKQSLDTGTGVVVKAKAKDSMDSIDTGNEQEHDVIRNYTFILDESSAKQTDSNSETLEDQEDQLVQLWDQIKNRFPILKNVPLKELIKTQSRHNKEIVIEPNQDDQTDGGQVLDGSFGSAADSSYEEFELRKIDNDRNLPTSQLRYNGQKTALDIDECNDIVENETLIKISKLNDVDDNTMYYLNENDSEKEDLKSTSSTECAVSNVVCTEQDRNKVPMHPSLKNKPLTSINLRAAQSPILLETQVEDFVKRYEPFPRFHHQPENQEAIKEKYESGVVKLRSIFEHQGE